MLGLMKCVGQAIASNGIKGLLGMVPGGLYLYDVGADALKRHKEKKSQKKLEDEIKQLIEARADAAFAAAKQAVEEVAQQFPSREKELLTQYLSAMPEAARQSMKRQEDPTGTSLPLGYTIHTGEDVAKLLPKHPPQFVAGELLPGLSSWRLDRRLGGGGFGEVWLAKHEWKNEQRAVKFCTNPEARARLVTHEKELIVRVMKHAGNHPNIVPLLECNLTGGTPWLMYEYVEGGTLADVIPTWQTLASPQRVNRVVALLYKIAAAVGHCHAMEPAIVHRDLKPANILVEGDVPRITDFGIGGTAVEYLIAEEKTHGHETMAGRLPSLLSGSYSPMYSSPQQRNRERPDPRDDVHALGVIAYQMLVGRVDAEVKGNWQKRLKADGVPEELVDLIGNSASDNADDRPANAREWEESLAELLLGKHPLGNITPSHETVKKQKKSQSGKQATRRAKKSPTFVKPQPDLFTPTPEVEPSPAPSAERQCAPSALDEIYADVRGLQDEQAVPAVARPATVDSSQKWHIELPGTWHSRPTGQPDAEWQEIATPAEVVTVVGEEYMLDLSGNISDDALEAVSQPP